MQDNEAFVRISTRDPRYLELSNGQPYIPIGLNLVGSPAPESFESVLDTMASNRINYCRLWMNRGSFLLERPSTGLFDETSASNLDRFLKLSAERNIRVKICLDYFRDITVEKKEWSDNPIHHQVNGGAFTDLDGVEPDQLTQMCVDMNGTVEHWQKRWRPDLSPLLYGAGKWKGRTYDPWSGVWQEAHLAENTIVLPPFRRSLVIRMERQD